MKSFSFDRMKPKVLDLNKLKKSNYLNNLEKTRLVGLISIDKEIDEISKKDYDKKLFNRDYSIFYQQNKFIPIDQSQKNALNTKYRYEYFSPKNNKKHYNKYSHKYINNKYKNLAFDEQLREIKNPYGPLFTINNNIKNGEFSDVIGKEIMKSKKIIIK